MSQLFKRTEYVLALPVKDDTVIVQPADETGRPFGTWETMSKESFDKVYAPVRRKHKAKPNTKRVRAPKETKINTVNLKEIENNA